METCNIKECPDRINEVFKTPVGVFAVCKRHHELMLGRCNVLDHAYADFKVAQALGLILIDPTETPE